MFKTGDNYGALCSVRLISDTDRGWMPLLSITRIHLIWASRELEYRDPSCRVSFDLRTRAPCKASTRITIMTIKCSLNSTCHFYQPRKTMISLAISDVQYPQCTDSTFISLNNHIRHTHHSIPVHHTLRNPHNHPHSHNHRIHRRILRHIHIDHHSHRTRY